MTPVVRFTSNEYKICLCAVFYKHLLISVIRTTLISLINMEVGINVEGGAKVAKPLNVEVIINVEGGIFWKQIRTT